MAMQYSSFGQTTPIIGCCLCGTPIEANPSSMCVECLRSQVDITEGIPKEVMIQWCRNCNRYLQPPKNWVACELESRELLVICIKRIKGLSKVKLTDAGFIWTEPHSRRLKVKLTVQKEVHNTILQQVFVVDFVVQNQMCEACHRLMAKDTWNAVVQVRQRVDHKRTFLYLEQLILRNKVHTNALRIVESKGGLDFFFAQRTHAQSFVDFLSTVMPIRYKTSERLISADTHSNTANFKYTLSVEIPPICKDDLAVLPRKLAQRLGHISPAVLCLRVSNLIHLLDPLSGQVCEMPSSLFWSQPFRSLCTAAQLVEYVVLDTEPARSVNPRYQMVEVTVARVSDFGTNDTVFHTRTHLGLLLQPGDLVWGYDTSTAVYNDADVEGFDMDNLPEAILVKKSYSNKRRRRRVWKLKRLEMEVEDEKKGIDPVKEARELEMFMQDLEEDAELRQRVALFKDPTALARAQADPSDAGDDYAPAVDLAELLDELAIDDGPDAAEAAAAAPLPPAPLPAGQPQFVFGVAATAASVVMVPAAPPHGPGSTGGDAMME